MGPSCKAKLPDKAWDREHCLMKPSFKAEKERCQIRIENSSLPDGAQF